MLQAAMPVKDIATSTGAFGFIRYVVPSSPSIWHLLFLTDSIVNAPLPFQKNQISNALVTTYVRRRSLCVSYYQSTGRYDRHIHRASYPLQRTSAFLSSSFSKKNLFCSDVAPHTHLSQTLRKRVDNIPGLDFDTSPAALSQGVRELHNIAVRFYHPFLLCATSQLYFLAWVSRTCSSETR